MAKSKQPEEKRHGPNERAQELNGISRQTPPPIENLPENEKQYVLQIRGVYEKCAARKMSADEAQAWQRWLQACLLQESELQKMVRESSECGKMN